MKRLIIAMLVAMSCGSAFAAGKGSPVHFGIGLNAGTNGVGIDASLGLTRFLQIRGGFSYVPNIDVNYNADIYNEANMIINAWNAFSPNAPIPTLPDNVRTSITPHLTTAHALLDIYPAGSFHFTVGAYFGQEVILSATNAEPGSLKPVAFANECIDIYNNSNIIPGSDGYQVRHIGVQVGDYIFTPDAAGNVQAEIRVKKVRPYAGIGFGRAVPRKHRVGCSLDLGVQYWGKPTYFSNGEEVAASEFSGDNQRLVKLLSNTSVYPVVTFRLCGRIF